MKTLVLDIETTGLPPKGASYDRDYMDFPHIVSLSFKVNNDPTRTFIINQNGRPVPSEATTIHGITNAMCEASPHQLAQVIDSLLNDGEGAEAVIGHNLYFDTSTIKANVLRLEMHEMYQTLERLLHKDRRVDTMQKTAKYMGGWKTLTALHERLFGCGFEAHRSEDDVEACYRCYHELKRIGVLA